MNKKYIIAALVVVLALYGAFWMGKRAAIAPEGQGSIPNGLEQATTTAPTTTVKVIKTTAPKTTSAPAMTKDGAYIVSYTDRGFVPATIPIAKGKSVHFVNNSNKAMSVTSSNTEVQMYSELNQGKVVGRGGVYDFTFLYVGTWNYHNRNNPQDKGVIMVK